MNWLKKLLKPKAKPFLIDKKYRVVPAFILAGVDYFQFDSAFEVPAGRAMTSLTIYEEFNQRCDRDYLIKHCRAIDIILSGGSGKIDLQDIARIHYNLKERLEMVAFPDHIYKMASVMFFDASESPYAYDFAYNEKKIQAWREAEGTLDFFLKTPFKELLPSLMLSQKNAETFFNVVEKVDVLHQKDLQEILSRAV